jgi:hypothetical protein
MLACFFLLLGAIALSGSFFQKLVSTIERLRHVVDFPDAKPRRVRHLTVPKRESRRNQGLHGSCELGRLMEGQSKPRDQDTKHADTAKQEKQVQIVGQCCDRDTDRDRPIRYIGLAEPYEYRRTVVSICLNHA